VENLTAEETGQLNELTEPTFASRRACSQWPRASPTAGTTINGASAPISEYAMPAGNQPY